MKIKYLSLSLILLTGCSTTPTPEQTPVIEETAEDPTTSWMTPTQKEKNEIDPFPEYTEIEGWHPQKNKGGEPDLGFPSIDPVFRDNIADSFAIHLKNYLDDPYAYWYHIYKKDDHVYETEDTTQCVFMKLSVTFRKIICFRNLKLSVTFTKKICFHFMKLRTSKVCFICL